MGLRRGRIHACATISRADARRGAVHHCRGRPGRRADQGPGHHDAEAAFRLQHRRRLPARHLRPVRRVLAEDRQGIQPDAGHRDRQDGGGPAASRRDHHRAGELRQARSLQADRAAAAPRARAQRRAGARPREGRQGGGLDRRRPARDGSRGRAPADRDGLPAREPHRRGDDAASCAT